MHEHFLVEPLDKHKHDRAAFSCGISALDTYIQEQATQDVRRNVSVTYVLTPPDSGTIIGYYSMSTSSVETTQLPRDITKRLPRYNALPTVLIGRLAIDRNYGGQGLGRLLLADAIKRCFKLSSEVGIAAVIVDAKDETAATFYEHFGFRRFADFPLKLYMPMAEIRQLMDEGR